MPTPPHDWTRDEVDLVIADYFAMLEFSTLGSRRLQLLSGTSELVTDTGSTQTGSFPVTGGTFCVEAGGPRTPA